MVDYLVEKKDFRRLEKMIVKLPMQRYQEQGDSSLRQKLFMTCRDNYMMLGLIDLTTSNELEIEKGCEKLL